MRSYPGLIPVLVLGSVLGSLVELGAAETPATNNPAASVAAGVSPRGHDADIDAIVRDISPERIEATVRQLVGFRTRHTLSTTTDPRTGIGAARNWIKAQFDEYSRVSGGRLQVAFDAFHQPPGSRVPDGADIVNVVATLPGADPQSADRMYVVSGHYDSRCTDVMDAVNAAPGADDDASGTAAVMEMARVMASHRFDATLVFMTVAGEEQGLYGSTHWAEEARRKGGNVAAMLNNDMVGNTHRDNGARDGSLVRLFAEGVTVPANGELAPEVAAQIRTGGENDFPTRQVARTIAAVAAEYVPGLAVRIVYRRDRYLRGGDHSPFLDRGYPAVRFTEPNEVFTRQHQDVRIENGVRYGDTPEYVDFPYVANVARVNAAALAELASAPACPRDVEIETARLENDTTLRWRSNSESDVAGYRIVWRETTAPQWQNCLDVPKETTRYTVKGLSKDNVVFGVEAFDRAGHCSPAVYPKPRRKA